MVDNFSPFEFLRTVHGHLSTFVELSPDSSRENCLRVDTALSEVSGLWRSARTGFQSWVQFESKFPAERATWLVSTLESFLSRLQCLYGQVCDFDKRPMAPDTAFLTRCLLTDQWRMMRDEAQNEMLPVIVKLLENETPVWLPDVGELRFESELVRTVAGRAGNCRRLLDAFQEDGWPRRIDCPLKDGKLGDTLKTLNDGLELLRFEADGTGDGVRWLKKSPVTPQ